MIRDEEIRFKLLYGPYDPPRTRRGQFLVCEWRGKVKVGGYSDGPIPWPVKWRTRNSLILCGDLVKAVQQESEVGVAYHWGVCIGTVQKWRRAVDAEAYTCGTQWLQHTQAVDNSPPSRIRELTEAARPAARKPKSRAWKRKMSQIVNQRIARQGPINPKHRPWTSEEDRLLGTKPDAELAALLNRSQGAIRTRRCSLGIDLENPHFKVWTHDEEKLLGTRTDAAVAKMLGRTERGVQLHRQTLGIALPATGSTKKRWTAEEDQLLETMPDREVAQRLGRSLATVQIRRHIKGIPNPAALRQPWTAEADALLGTQSDEELARVLGRSVHAIITRRSLRKIPNPKPKRKLWTPEEMRILGTRPDSEVAQELRCPVRAVTTKRVHLGIQAFL